MAVKTLTESIQTWSRNLDKSWKKILWESILKKKVRVKTCWNHVFWFQSSWLPYGVRLKNSTTMFKHCRIHKVGGVFEDTNGKVWNWDTQMNKWNAFREFIFSLLGCETPKPNMVLELKKASCRLWNNHIQTGTPALLVIVLLHPLLLPMIITVDY